ncbi:MAG: hypothetical protein IPP18_01230 [Rhodocyclaceae bacterium]|nr:hypothetical protein [Rhodocyclaceae bacterium]
MSLLVTPLALVGALPLGEPFAGFAHWLTEWLMKLLYGLSALQAGRWRQRAPPAWAKVALGVAGVGAAC